MRIMFLIFLCGMIWERSSLADSPQWLGSTFYSYQGREREARFSGFFRTNMRSLDEVRVLTEQEKQVFAQSQVEPTLKFLFGPLTHRSLGGPQRDSWIQIDWDSGRLVSGRVILRYEYKGVWILSKDLADRFQLPVPLNKNQLFTRRWKNCTDSAPEHQTEWFFWYYWDPNRGGCDHKEGVHYQMVEVALGAQTVNQPTSFPEYEKLFKSTGATTDLLQLTFAFGYVEDPMDPNPDTDWDAGILEYRNFVAGVRGRLGDGFKETPIYQSEYRSGSRPGLVLGRRFAGKMRSVDVVINVVAAAGVDQMELFAKSFAHDHDAFFGWFGHSRVGSGFDAERFWEMVESSPEYYSISTNYQIVYWGGCNSYSYYTLPFFEFKARAANGADPHGTRGLDIIANGLPSYFSLNADNAEIVLGHLLSWERRPSYQMIVGELEDRAQRAGISVLVAVLGDEDNQ